MGQGYVWPWVLCRNWEGTRIAWLRRVWVFKVRSRRERKLERFGIRI